MTSLDVCAAVIFREEKILLATRPPGSHLAGKWEFPGGKVHADETWDECIRREIHEELGLDVDGTSFLTVIEHTYPEKHIRLIFMRCTVCHDCTPICHDGQVAEWFFPSQLAELDLAPADRAFVAWMEQNPSAFH